jgi:hypothetical protein
MRPLDQTLKIDARHFCLETPWNVVFWGVPFWNNFSKHPLHADVAVVIDNFHGTNYRVFSQRDMLVKICGKVFNIGGWLPMEAIA